MKKSIIAIAVIAGAVVIGAPYITGSMAESETRSMVEQLNANSAQYGSATITAYDRGFRNSKVSYEYEFPAGLAAMTKLEQTFKYDCEYAHGITGIDYSCDLNSNEFYQKMVSEHFDGQDPISITGAISAFGGLTQEIASTAIDKTAEDGTVLKLQPSRLLIESDASFSVFDSTAEFGEMNLSGGDGSIKMKPSSMDWRLKPTESGLYEGDYSMSVGELEMVNDDQSTSLVGLNLSGSNVERGDKMDSSLVVKVKSMAAQGVQTMSIEDAVISFDLLGLNSQALVEYQEFITNLQTDLMAEIQQGGEPTMDPNQMMAILPIVEKMLDKDLNLKMSVAGKLMGKPNAVDVDVKLLEKTSFAQLSAFMFNPESILKSFDVRLSTSLNKDLINGHPMAGPMIGKSPLFTQDGDSFETKIKLGAESEVNGKKVSFQELQGMVMSGMM